MLSKELLEKVSAVEPQVKFFKREDKAFGDVVIARNTDTKRHYLIKEKVYTNAAEFKAEAGRLQKRLALSHSNLLKFHDYSTISKIDDSGECYKLRLYFDYCDNSLDKEMLKRKARAEDFPTEELLLMASDLISACAYLEEKGGSRTVHVA